METTLSRVSCKLAVLGVVLNLASLLAAESLTLTSYYPSPAGNYRIMTVTGNSYFATSSGSVGIGTTSPSNKIHISGGDLRVSNTANTKYFTLRQSGGALDLDAVGAALYLNADNNLYINSSAGNVGIGIASASQKLYVQGNAYFSGNVGIGSTSPGAKLDIVDSTTPGGVGTINVTRPTSVSGTTFGLNVNLNGIPPAGSSNVGASFSAGGGSGQKIGIQAFASGAGDVNTAAYFSASGAIENRGLEVNVGKAIFRGSVGVGTGYPASSLQVMDVGGGNCNAVGTSGYITTGNASTGLGLCLDTNELQARNTNSWGTLYLNWWGGSIIAGCDSLWVDGGTTISCVDIAETYDAGEDMEPGDVIAVKPDTNHKLFKARSQADEHLIGIYSTSPAFLLGLEKGRLAFGPGKTNDLPKGKMALTLAGRAPVKVTIEGGSIKPGDFLTSSSKPGYAMKATKKGRVLGMALEAFDGKDKQEGKILAFINPHWWDGGEVGRLTETVNRLNDENEALKLRLDKLEKRLAEK